MSKFKELFQDAIYEFNDEDQAAALSIGALMDFWKEDIADMQKVFPDLPAESVTRPVEEAADMLELVSEREQAAQARGAKKAEAFFSFVADALRHGLDRAAPE